MEESTLILMLKSDDADSRYFALSTIETAKFNDPVLMNKLCAYFKAKGYSDQSNLFCSEEFNHASAIITAWCQSK